MAMDLLTLPGQAPARSQPGDVFAPLADAFISWLVNHVGEMNAIIPVMNAAFPLLQPAIDAAVTALQAPGTQASSTSSVALPASMPSANLSFTIEKNKLLTAGMTLDAIATGAPGNHVVGKIASYNSTTGALVLQPLVVEGSGTWSSWTLVLAPLPLTTARNPIVPKSASFTLSASDKGSVFPCSAGITINFPSPLTGLGADFYCWILNESTTPVALSNGGTIKTLAPRTATVVMCDGTVIKFVDSDPKSAQSRVSGLTGTLNSATPTSKYDLTARQITFVNATGDSVRKDNFSATVDLNLAGPAANGRGQSAAFGNGTWVHLYAIINASTGVMASLASTLDPWSFVATQLPAGYTHWAYLTTIYKNGSGAIVWTVARGSYQLYAAAATLVSQTAVVGETTSSTNALVPPVSPNFVLGAEAWVEATSAGQALFSAGVRAVSTNDAIPLYVNAAANYTAYNMVALQMPNLGQVLYQTNANGAINAVKLNLRVHGYFVPNGDN